MKLIEIYKRKNVMNCTFDFTIIILGIKFQRVVPYGKMLLDSRIPLFLTLSRFILQKTCEHEWEKIPVIEIEGLLLGDGNVFVIQKVRCKKCEKKDTYRYTLEA